VQPPKEGDKPATDEPKKDEAYWKARVAKVRDDLQRAQTFADALQSRINALTTDFTARADPAQRAVIGSDRQKALTEMERVKKEIEAHTKAIADIQEEARKANVPPGWVR
jgi:seryl-tRNA synthetase